MFGLARVQKLFTIALIDHTFIRVFSFPIQSSDICSKKEEKRKSANSALGKCNQAERALGWCKRHKRLRNTSHVELDAQLVKCFVCAKDVFQSRFLLNLFENMNLCTSYIKQIMNAFSFVQWNNYFHLVKDEMSHLIFHLMKIFVPLHS